MNVKLMESQTSALESEILELGRLVEIAIARAVTALTHHDPQLARLIVAEDMTIDRAEVEINERCLRILEQERPTGSDLRFVVAVLKISDGLERIGDLAENVAEIVIQIADWERFHRINGIDEMATGAQAMVEKSLEALIQRDAQLARRTIQDDDRIDAAQERINERIEQELDRIPENASLLLKVANVVRQFERMADIACNICEEVVFLIEGHIVRHAKSLL